MHSFTETATHITTAHNDLSEVFFVSEAEEEEREEASEEPRSSSRTLLRAFTEFHGALQVTRWPSYCESKKNVLSNEH